MPYAESSTNAMHAVSLQLQSAIMSASALLEQPPPPSVREILSAYSSRGDGDREMLLAMLSAKSAEDQRLASVANLQRGLLDVYQSASHGSQSEWERERTSHSPPPSCMRTPESPPSRTSSRSHTQDRHHPYRQVPTASRRGRSPHTQSAELQNFSDAERKRHRAAPTIDVSQHSSRGQAPLSPCMSSRSSSMEGSPRARSPRSMAIDNLLTSAPANASMDEQKPILTSAHPAIVRAT